MPKKLNIEELKRLALSKGGECLSEIYIGIDTKYIWKCDKGHEWKATFHNVKRKSWCPACAGCKKRDLSYLLFLAKENEGICLSSEYKNMNTKYLWKCQAGHEWEAKANTIQQGHWCNKCGGSYVKDLSYLQELAKERKGECLSNFYKNANTKYVWQCFQGHIWEATYANISQGQWCGRCIDRTSKPQRVIYNHVVLNYPDAELNAKVLFNKRYELDIYVPSLKKAIEYDGYYWHDYETFPNREKTDLDKDIQCKESDIEILRIKEIKGGIIDYIPIFNKIELFLNSSKRTSK